MHEDKGPAWVEKGRAEKSWSAKDDLNPAFSQHIEDEEVDFQPSIIADEVSKSGLRFKPIRRKRFDFQSLEFLCWLPDAVKSFGKKKDKKGDSEGKHEDGDNNETESDNDPRDEGVCIVRLVPNKPDDDFTDGKAGRKNCRVFRELTWKEWRWVQSLRSALGTDEEEDGSCSGGNCSDMKNEDRARTM